LVRSEAPVLSLEVRVQLKPGVVDAEAGEVLKALRLLKVRGLSDVGISKVYTLRFPGLSSLEARRRAERAVEQLLANPVIHQVTIGRPRKGPRAHGPGR
jgi:phosphoribosylformylglycinamidine synthase PurS subunit